MIELKITDEGECTCHVEGTALDVSAQILEGIENLLRPIPETLRNAIILALPVINERIEKEQE